MTREKAIATLKFIKAFENGWLGRNATGIALDMAIAALRYDGPKYVLLSQPPEDAQYIDTGVFVQPHWISVEERLPEDGVDVLTRRAVGMSVEAHCGWGWTEDGYHTKWRVTHWMPLPEPPEVEV